MGSLLGLWVPSLVTSGFPVWFHLGFPWVPPFSPAGAALLSRGCRPVGKNWTGAKKNRAGSMIRGSNFPCAELACVHSFATWAAPPWWLLRTMGRETSTCFKPGNAVSLIRRRFVSTARWRHAARKRTPASEPTRNAGHSRNVIDEIAAPRAAADPHFGTHRGCRAGAERH